MSIYQMGKSESLSTKDTLWYQNAYETEDRCSIVTDQDHVHECMTMVNKKAGIGSYRFLPNLSLKGCRKVKQRDGKVSFPE